MKLRLAQPTMLIDIGRIKDLSYIKDAGDHIAIGALTRHMDIENSVFSNSMCRCSLTRLHMWEMPRCAIAAPLAAHLLMRIRPATCRQRHWHLVQLMSPRGHKVTPIAAKDFYQAFESAKAR